MISTLIEMLAVFFQAGDLAQVEVVARSVLASIPEDLVALQFLGLALYQMGRTNEARDVFAKVRPTVLSRAQHPCLRTGVGRSGAGTRRRQGGIYNATNAFQDPHHVQAKPSLLARARNADMVVCTGSQLEIGWLPILQQQAGNARIQAGQPGYFEAAQFVRMLEVPSSVDRSLGDVHPGGNPHIQTDPRNIGLVAAGIRH